MFVLDYKLGPPRVYDINDPAKAVSKDVSKGSDLNNIKVLSISNELVDPTHTVIHTHTGNSRNFPFHLTLLPGMTCS